MRRLAAGFPSVRACYEWMLNEEKPLRAESRDLGLKQHWVDFPGRSAAGMTKAQQKRLVGSVAVDESLLTPAVSQSPYGTVCRQCSGQVRSQTGAEV